MKPGGDLPAYLLRINDEWLFLVLLLFMLPVDTGEVELGDGPEQGFKGLFRDISGHR